MYQYIDSYFASKYLLPDTLYDVQAGTQFMRIKPYTGSKKFGYLKWSENKGGPYTIQVPTELKKRSGIKSKTYVLQVDDTFYLLHPDFRGEIEDLKPDKYDKFTYKKNPEEVFFNEATIVSPQIVSVDIKKNRIMIPLNLRQKLNINRKSNFTMTLFNMNGRKWAEMAAVTEEPTSLNNRLSSNTFIDSINGITYKVSPIGHSIIPATFRHVGALKGDNFYCWYSDTRNAIIFEELPQECAICGEVIRSIAPEHHKIQICYDCAMHTGPDNALDVLATAHKVTNTTEELIKKLATM
jgi:hypothetical protein